MEKSNLMKKKEYEETYTILKEKENLKENKHATIAEVHKCP